MNIIGISANFHDSSCALIQDSKLIAAVSEERFSRFKNDARLPIRAFRYCLEAGKIDITDIDCIAYYENPYKKLLRQLSSGANLDLSNELNWIDCHKPFREINEILGYEGQIKFYDHHLSHAASSYFFSGFTDAAILTSDGVGEWATTTYGIGQGPLIELFKEIKYPHSIGLLYSTITNYLGFEVLSGEYKVMGLAPYGEPLFVDKLQQLFNLNDDGDFELNMEYFDFSQIDHMYTHSLTELLKLPPREPKTEINQKHLDLAKSLQLILEQIVLKQIHGLKNKVTSSNLCMSGGVALNCVANHAVRNSGLFKHIFIQPASGDAGSAMGAAALAHIDIIGKNPNNQQLCNAYLGPKYTDEDIYSMLSSMEIEAFDFRDNPSKLYEAVVDRIIAGKVIGWFQGRMEFGPRALGARSIIADPRDPTMRDRLNMLVKKRESFRPFAPAILEEHTENHIDLNIPTPFMLETCQVISTLDLPAITHVDGSCRPQTVSAKTNPKFHALLTVFYQRTNCPILVNTSFNVKNEPIVCTPLDALRCFGNSGIDALVLENFLIDRTALPEIFFTMAKQEAEFIKPPQDLFMKTQTEGIYTFI